MIGVAVGDALGLSAQFVDREELRESPVTEMEGDEIYGMPAGSWSDDTSMAIAILDSIRTLGQIDCRDIMDRFVQWLFHDAYTPTGETFDEGNTCSMAIAKYLEEGDVLTCGRTGEYANGNGSLMRTMPVCLFGVERVEEGIATVDQVIHEIHEVSALTHHHLRAEIGCGLYFFLVQAILKNQENDEKTLPEVLQEGLDAGFAYYSRDIRNLVELAHYGRLRDLGAFADVPEEEIKSSGYVVATLEAAVWCLLGTKDFRDCLVKAVNLGDDADTVGAVAGGFAGLYYGYDEIPEAWLSTLQKREYLEELCRKVATAGLSDQPGEKSIPCPVTDIHSHLLPGVDDGSASAEESVEMIQMLLDQGCGTLFLTSHGYNIYDVDVREKFQKFQEEVRARDLPIKLYLGCEIFMDDAEEVIRMIRNGELPTMNETDYVMIEYDAHDVIGEEIVADVRTLTAAGYRPILAHAERYRKLNEGDIRRIRDAGCLIQMNYFSFVNDLNQKTRERARNYLDGELVDFMGSDAHRMHYRQPVIAEGIQYILKNCRADYAKKILAQNAEDLLILRQVPSMSTRSSPA